MTLIIQLVLLIIHKIKTFSVDNTQNRPLCYVTHFDSLYYFFRTNVLQFALPSLRNNPTIDSTDGFVEQILRSTHYLRYICVISAYYANQEEKHLQLRFDQSETKEYTSDKIRFGVKTANKNHKNCRFFDQNSRPPENQYIAYD